MITPKVSPRLAAAQERLPQKEGGQFLPRDVFPKAKGTQLGPLLLFLETKFRAPRAVMLAQLERGGR
jgi:hypothetical protein